MTVVVQAREVCLAYRGTPALQGCSLEVAAGERVALMGPSGSGKSSLLHCLAGVLRPDSGSVVFDGVDLAGVSEARRSRLRLQRMGVVFQFGDLVPELPLVENVMLPGQLLGMSSRRARAAAMTLLERLGVAEVADRRAGSVSGGQAQRAAVARAVIHEPAVVFADEPTGALDTVTAELVLDALVELSNETGAALVVVTHDHQVAAHLDRLVTIRDGRVAQPTGVGA
ncbi:MAG: ABC transporter ATP-binding protein [Nocardioidaceae bacterium]